MTCLRDWCGRWRSCVGPVRERQRATRRESLVTPGPVPRIAAPSYPSSAMWCGSGHRHSRAGRRQVKARGVELAAGLGVRPDPHLVVLSMGRVGEDLLELLIAGQAAGVLRRAGAFAPGAGRVGLADRGLGPRLDSELVLPPVAEVVFILNPRARVRH